MKTVSGSTRIPTVPAFSCISMSANRAQIHAYRGELISLLAPYDNYDRVKSAHGYHRIGDGIVGTPITLTFLLLIILILFSLSPSFFSSFFSLSISTRFDPHFFYAFRVFTG